MAHKDRSLVLLFMGGGMGAGKSTALKDILKEYVMKIICQLLASYHHFWQDPRQHPAKCRVMEADARKESDVIYRALSSRDHHDMLQTAELVHQSSTDAASSLLVTALNEGRDVIMDGTLSWEQLDEESEPLDGHTKRRPYRIELRGVVCDPYLAVIRGISSASDLLSYSSLLLSSGLTVCVVFSAFYCYSLFSLLCPPSLLLSSSLSFFLSADHLLTYSCAPSVCSLLLSHSSVAALSSHLLLLVWSGTSTALLCLLSLFCPSVILCFSCLSV
ncbi:hypothetical protein Tco_0158200, partial [Tanacetum coccineum]